MIYVFLFLCVILLALFYFFLSERERGRVEEEKAEMKYWNEESKNKAEWKKNTNIGNWEEIQVTKL